MSIYKNKLKFKAMEEKTQPKKLSYDELKAKFAELYQQYQKLASEYQKALAALQERDFNYISFFLSMLFKVTEHSELYSAEFITWVIENIEASLRSFDESMRSGAQSDTKKKKDEAE